MKLAVIAGLLCCSLLGSGGYIFMSGAEKQAVTGSVTAPTPASASARESDARVGMSVVKVDWRREGFGLTAVADVSVRNNNAYAVQVDRINCRFRSKDGEMEDHAQGVYSVIQPRAERTIRSVSLGFVSSEAKGIDCRVVGARKGL